MVVLVVSAIALTLGLSLSRKTATETKVETDEEALKQAFNAAESGIDYYLSTGTTRYTAPDSKSMAEVTVADIGGTEIIDTGEYIRENYYAYFWLVGHGSNGAIDYKDYYPGTAVDICVDNGFGGSVVIGYFFRDGGGNFRQRRYVKNYGSDPNIIPNPNATDTLGCSSGKKGVGVALVAGTTPLLVTVMPVFGGGKIAMESVEGGVFPVQGKEVLAIGRAGEVSRKLGVERRYKIPGFMLEAVAGVRVLN